MTTMITIELTEKEYADYLNFKNGKVKKAQYLKKYHSSDKGKEKRRLAQKKYREKKKKEKLQKKLNEKKQQLLEELNAIETEITKTNE